MKRERRWLRRLMWAGGGLVIAWLLTSIKPDEWRAVGLVLAVATVLFFFRRKQA